MFRVESSAAGALWWAVTVLIAEMATNPVVADSGAFLGDDLLPLLVLALGGALLLGNVFAVMRPPPATQTKEGDLTRAPVGRSLVMAAVGLVAALWALASLLTK